MINVKQLIAINDEDITPINAVAKGIKKFLGDGLCCDGCGCELGDLAPCGDLPDECVIADRSSVTRQMLADFEINDIDSFSVREGEDWFTPKEVDLHESEEMCEDEN